MYLYIECITISGIYHANPDSLQVNQVTLPAASLWRPSVSETGIRPLSLQPRGSLILQLRRFLFTILPEKVSAMSVCIASMPAR